jgi:hypothetical protein
MDIRAKVLSVVVLSALAPALLVGVASYLTAREILIEKVNNQLNGRAASSSEQMTQWFRERAYDSEVFANSFIVSENLRRWELAKRSQDKRSAEESRKKLQEYLDQVQNRYPLYRELFIVDQHGTLVAKTQPFIEEVDKEIAPENETLRCSASATSSFSTYGERCATRKTGRSVRSSPSAACPRCGAAWAASCSPSSGNFASSMHPANPCSITGRALPIWRATWRRWEYSVLCVARTASPSTGMVTVEKFWERTASSRRIGLA